MAFGTGFLQGLQVGQSYKHNQELMRQKKEDRDREAYGRDLEGLMNDWTATKGDRTDAEFVNSDEFAALAKRHRGSKVFERAIQAGMEDGRVAKLRDIRKSPDGRNVMIVDTYDKEGRLISKGRPVTEGRTSREKDPKGKVSQFTNQELYDGMLGALQQSPDFVDRRGLADRFEDSLDALDPAGKSTTSGGVTTPTTAGDEDTQIKDEAPAPAARTAPVEGSGPAVATPVENEEGLDEEGEPLPTQAELVEQQKAELIELEGRFNVLRAELDELEEIDNRSSSQMTREQYVNHRRELMMKSNELGEVQGAMDELSGSSTSRRMGAALSEVPGDFVKSVGEFGEAIADIPAVKGVTEVVSDFFGGLKSGEGTPPPKGTKSSERFEHGAESQANAARKDKAGGLEQANLKDRTRAQQNKIQQVNERTALAVANNQKLSRKMLSDYRKALRAQVIHGDVTVAQATTSYYAVLKATKGSDKYKLHLDSKNGVAFTINEADGSVSRSKYAAGEAATESAKDAAAYDDKQYKRLTTIGEIVTRGDEHAMADFMAVADQSRDALDLIMTQPGAHSVISGAYNAWSSVVRDEANWDPFVSTGDAKRKNPSLSPFIAARVLALPEPEQVNEFAGELAYINGGNKLTEEHWKGIIVMSQKLAVQGIQGKQAMEAILNELRGL